MSLGQPAWGMDRKTSKSLKTYAAKTGQTTGTVKRDWLKLSHRERGPMRRALTGAKKAGGGK